MRLGLEQMRKVAAGTTGQQPQRQAPLSERVGARVGYRARTLGLGVMLAVLAGVLTLVYVNRAERRAALTGADVRVFVAQRDIPAGTPGATVLARRLLVPQRVPQRSVVSGAIAEPGQIRELLAAEWIYAGEQITTRRFKPVAEQGVRGELSGTSRAIVVAGSATQLADGLLRTGDRVDVLAAMPFESAAGKQVQAARIILRDLLVVRGPGAEAAAGGRSSTTVALALTDAQAQKLFFAMNNGPWTLLLRPFGRPADSRTRVETADSVLGVRR
jgi:Flp pilus assembly protein CpaB